MTAPPQQDKTIPQKEEKADEIVEKTERINRKVAQEKERVSKVGDFGTAYCKDYEFKENPDNDDSSNRAAIVFAFITPDEETVTLTKPIKEEYEAYLETQNAASLYDIIGAGHTCIKTYNGWKLLRTPNAKEKHYKVQIDNEDDVTLEYKPTKYIAFCPWILAIIFSFLSVTSIFELLTAILAFVMMATTLASILVGKLKMQEI